MGREDTNQAGPGYPEIAAAIRAKIAAGEFEFGGYLPSQRTLAETFGVNRRTVIRGLALLEEQGVIRSDSTRGRLVVPDARIKTGPIGLCVDSSLPSPERVVHTAGERLLIANGISRCLSAEGIGRTLAWCDPSADQALPSPTVARQMGLAGLAVWPTLPTTPNTEHRLRALRSEMPLVLLDRRVPGFESDFVGFDDFDAGRQLARHLLTLGHRRFAFIGWSIPETVHHRLDGVLAELRKRESELPLDATLLAREDRVPTECFESLLRLSPRPTAVICANDLIAVGLMAWLRDRDLKVPEDFAVVGVGNTTAEMLDAIGLTTIALPHTEVGWEAATLLLSRLGGHHGNDAPPRERRLPVRLVIRRSCGTGMSRPAMS